MRVAVITGSSTSGLACMRSLLQKTVSSGSSSTSSSPPSAVDLMVRGCFRFRGKAATARSSLPAEALQNSYEVHSHVDASNMDSLRHALEGMDRAMLVTPSSSGGRKRRQGNYDDDAANSINMIQAAKEVGVNRIVHVGCWTANNPDRLPTSSARVIPTEDYLKDEIGDSMEWTVLRGGYFMSNFAQFHAGSINTEHALLAVPDCKLAPVDASDIGEAAANLLTLDDSDKYQREYHKSFIECCGSDIYSHEEIAKELSAGIGRTIGYPTSSPKLSEWLIDEATTDDVDVIMRELYSYLADEVSPGHQPCDPDATFESILGRPLTTLRQWAYNNRVLFGGKGY